MSENMNVQNIITILRDRGLVILVTDHNGRETLAVVDRAYLICDGKILFNGDSDSLVHDENARKLYLGPAFNP